MGTVWRAHDELLDRTVAVKEVDLPQVGEIDKDHLRQRTMREARAAARLAHPNAVTVYDVVEEGGKPWIVMQLVAADSLAQVIRDRGPLEPAEVAEIGLAVLSALEAAHAAGILHRDVKPGNVLLGHDGRVVLTDFGIATLEGDPSLTSTGLLLGAPAYIAPERARGLTPGPPSDLWSLGATLYTTIEGRPPFDRGTPLATLTAMISEDSPPPSIDGPLGAAIEGLLQRDPHQRIDALTARKLLEQAHTTAVVPPAEALATTLETPVPAPADEVSDGGVVAAADHTQVTQRPGSAAAESPAAQVRSTAPDPTPSATPGQALPPAPGVVDPSRRPSTPGDKNRTRVAVQVALAVLLIGALVAVALLANRDREPAGTSQAGGPSATPTTGASRDTSPPPTNPGAPTGPAGPAGGITPGTAPAGYTLYRDPTGFNVAVPKGWQKTRQRAGQFDFQDPTSGQFLRLAYTSSPKDDPEADWQQQEQSLRARYPNYQRISIEEVDYRDYATADWDFTIGSTRVKNRGFKVDESHGYAIYISAPESQFAAAMTRFQVATSSFKPAS